MRRGNESLSEPGKEYLGVAGLNLFSAEIFYSLAKSGQKNLYHAGKIAAWGRRTGQSVDFALVG